MNSKTLAVWVMTAVCGTVLAQPGGEPPRGEKPREGQPVDREGIRSRLQHRLEESRRNQERLEAALKKLDEGAEPADVLRELDLPGRLGARRDARGPEGRGEGPEGRPDGPPMGRGEGPMGRPEGEPGPMRDTQPGAPLAGQDRERIHAFLTEHMPEFARRVESVREVDPQAADRMIMRLAPKIREAMGFMKRDPEMFRLRLDEMKGGIDVLEAVREYRAAQSKPADSPGREDSVKRATERLRTVLGTQFDLRTRVMQRDIEVLAKRLEEMKADLEKRRGGRDSAIDDMLGKMGGSKEPGDLEMDGKRPARRGGPPSGGG